MKKITQKSFNSSIRLFARIRSKKNMQKNFTQKVLDVVRKIPKGKMMTYKEVAKKAGSANASRAVGSILKQNYDPKIPCHRVIPTSPQALRGKPLSEKDLGEYNRGRAEKIRKLRAEGAIS